MKQRLSAWINAHGHHRDRDPALTNENPGDRVEA